MGMSLNIILGPVGIRALCNNFLQHGLLRRVGSSAKILLGDGPNQSRGSSKRNADDGHKDQQARRGGGAGGAGGAGGHARWLANVASAHTCAIARKLSNSVRGSAGRAAGHAVVVVEKLAVLADSAAVGLGSPPNPAALVAVVDGASAGLERDGGVSASADVLRHSRRSRACCSGRDCGSGGGGGTRGSRSDCRRGRRPPGGGCNRFATAAKLTGTNGREASRAGDDTNTIKQKLRILAVCAGIQNKSVGSPATGEAVCEARAR